MALWRPAEGFLCSGSKLLLLHLCILLQNTRYGASVPTRQWSGNSTICISGRKCRGDQECRGHQEQVASTRCHARSPCPTYCRVRGHLNSTLNITLSEGFPSCCFIFEFKFGVGVRGRLLCCHQTHCASPGQAVVDTSRPAPHRSVHRHTEAAVLFSFLVQPQLLVLNHQTAFNNPYQPASQPAAGYMSAMAEEYD